MAGENILGDAYVRLRSLADGTFEADARATMLPAIERLAGDAALLWAGKKIFDIGKEGVDRLGELQKTDAQTAARLQATGGAAGVTAAQVEELATQMQKLAGVDHEQVAAAENVILMFDNVKNKAGEGNDIFSRTTKSALDLSVALGTDVSSAATTLGQVLENPEQGMQRLRRAHVVLTDAQKASIKTFQDEGDVLSAQKIILDAVEHQVGNAAKMYGETLPAQLARAQSAEKDAKAELVGGFAPAIELGAHLTAGFADVLGSLPAPARDAAGAVVLLGGGVLTLVRPASDLLNLLSRWKIVHGEAAASTQALAAAEAEKSAATSASTEILFSNSGALAAQAEAQATAAAAAKADEVAQTQLAAAFLRAEAMAIAAAGGTIVAAESEALLATNSAAAVAGLYEIAIAETAVGDGAVVALGPIGVLAIAAGGLIVALGLVGGSEHNAAVDTADFTQALKDQNGTLDDNVDKVSAHALAQDAGARAAADAGVSYKTLFDAIRNGTDDFGAYSRAFDQSGSIATDVGKQLRDAGAGNTEFGRTLLDLYDSGKLSNSQLGDLVNTVAGLHNKYRDSSTASAAEKQALGDVSGAASDASSSVGGLTDATDYSITPANKAAEAQKALAAAITQRDQGQQKMLTSVQTLDSAEKSYESAQHGVETANRSLADAERNRADAVLRLTDAQTALTNALQGASAEDLGKGQLDIQDANFRVADSSKAVSDAEKQLEKDRRLGRSPKTLAADQEALEKAQIAYQRSVYGVTDAEGKLQDLQKKGTDQDPAVASARKGVADATRGIADANQRIIDAKDALNNAYETEATASGKLKDAQDGLYGGTVSATTALQNELTALQGIDGQLTGPAKDRLDQYIRNLFVLAGIFQTPDFVGPGLDTAPPGYVPSIPPGPGPGPPPLRQRAAGGSVSAGGRYNTSEVHDELLLMHGSGARTMPADGWVFNAQQTAALLGSSGGGDSYAINFLGPVLNEDVLGHIVRRELSRLGLLSGRAIAASSQVTG